MNWSANGSGLVIVETVGPTETFFRNRLSNKSELLGRGEESLVLPARVSWVRLVGRL